jgi:hypothetical protein
MTMAPDPAEIDHAVRRATEELLAVAAGAMVPHPDIAAATGFSDEVVEDSLRRQQQDDHVRFYADGAPGERGLP